ncbi:cyclic nucleotide-binding domain-containing protein [Actinomadura sp. DSM 109109]|nr:cyclic nucleotide-binding domain-containing protein [Actinomadura lepetitiana]
MRRELCGAGRVRVFPDGARLFAEGRRLEKVMVLFDAHVRVTRAAGKGEKWLACRGPGDIVGEMALVLDVPHSADVVTVRGGRVLVLSHEAFDAVARRHDALQRALLRVMAERLRSSDEERSAAEQHVLPRVARLLSGPAPDVRPAAPPRFQHEIADLLGVSRASVVRALSTLRSSGVVSTRHGSITVLDPAGLTRFLPR